MEVLLLCAKQAIGYAEDVGAEIRRRDQGAQSWRWTGHDHKAHLRYAKSRASSNCTTVSASSLRDEGMQMRTFSLPTACVVVCADLSAQRGPCAAHTHGNTCARMPLAHLALRELVRRCDREARPVVEEARADERVCLVHHLVAAATGHAAANRRAGKSGFSAKIKIKAQGCDQNGVRRHAGHTSSTPPAPRL